MRNVHEFGAGIEEIEPPRIVTCPGCYGNGSWQSECCNGSGGCSCRGEVVDMGCCKVCGGRGEIEENACDLRANIRSIHGLHFLGCGPNSMYSIWPNRGGFV